MKNEGTFFKRATKIDFEEAEKIDYDEDNETPGWIKFWGVGGGKIKIEYLGRKRRFGQDLTIEEAKSLTEQMMTEFDKRKAMQPLY